MKDSRYQTEYKEILTKKSNKKAEVSVIIPVYNYSRYIIETLESVYSQTLKRIDLVIVDDRSTDNSLDIIHNWLKEKQNRFNNAKLITLSKNYGVTYARNTAIENTDTEYIFTLDADNLILQNCLEELLESIKKTDASFAYPILEKFGDEEGLLNTSFWDINYLKIENYIDNMVLIRKSIWNAVGGYSNHIPIFGWEDYDLWFKIARAGGWGLQVPKILAKYRVHNKSLIKTHTKNYIPELQEYIRKEYFEFFNKPKQVDKESNLPVSNDQFKIILENFTKLQKQIKQAHNTSAWKIMVLIHRIYNELIRSFNLDFFKWLYYRIFTNKMPSNLDLSKYEPIDLDLVYRSLDKTDLAYSVWLKKYLYIDNEKREKIKEIIEKFEKQPKISIIMPTYNSNIKWLEQSIGSVKAQLYDNWELCIADDASDNIKVKELIKKLAEDDNRIKYVFRDKNGHISEASNSALELATGEFTGILDHDDLITEDALFWVVYYFNKNPDMKLVYSDNDKLDPDGNLIYPFFKPDWNYQIMLSFNLIAHFALYNTKILKEIGGFRKGYEGSQDYDISLRFIEQIDKNDIIHIPKVLYHWRMHPESLAMNTKAKTYAYSASTKAISEHFDRMGIKAKITEDERYLKRINYELPQNLPLVSIIIPTKNNYDLLKKCVESVLKKTTYNHYEIILVDNNSDDLQTLSYIDSLRSNPKITVLNDKGEFNYSRINNNAVNFAKGELLCLLNDDTEVIEKNWLNEMVANIIQKNVAIVGAKLLFLDGRIQHAGVILGLMNGAAGHILSHADNDETGYFNRAIISQNFSAVTAACMLIKKDIFLQAGGLDEEFLKVAFNDIDLCLKVRELGYDIVWTPYALLYHKESASRGYDDTEEKMKRCIFETDNFIKRWKKQIDEDPAYNPNLTLDSQFYEIAVDSRAITIDEIYNEYNK